jgi:hypothetical protein
MSRCLQEWGCLPRSRPKLLMTGSNWEVEDGADPSLVNNSSGTFLFFGQLSIRLVDRPRPVRLGLGLAQVIPPRKKPGSCPPRRSSHTASKVDVGRLVTCPLYRTASMPPSTARTTCCANASAARRPRLSVKTPSAPRPQGSRPGPTHGAAARSPSFTTTRSARSASRRRASRW